MVEVVVLRRRLDGPVAGKPAAIRKPMTPAEIVLAIGNIRERAHRLRPPLPHKPSAWHEDKSELVRDLMDLEEAVRSGTPLRAR